MEHSHLSNVEVKNEWKCGGTLPLTLISSCFQQRNFIFNSKYEHCDYDQDSYT